MGNHFQEEFVEEYLEALHRLDTGDDYVKNQALARQLGISPASVTEMVQRLAEKGYVDYKRYYGARLTEKGQARATRIHNRHRMLELFLSQVLGMEGDNLHETACKLEHALSPQLERLIGELVRHAAPPELELPPCPELDIENGNRHFHLLDSLPPSSSAKIRAVLTDGASQTALSRLGLVVGRDITRLGTELEFALGDGSNLTLDSSLARRVLVEG